MPSAKLSNTFCKSAKCLRDKPKTDYHDTILKGFNLEVRSSGGKTFRLRYRTDNKTHVHRIGDANVISANQAREVALKLKADIILGNTPTEKKRAQQTIPTLSHFFHKHYLPYAKQQKKSWRADRCIFEIHILPYWGTLKITEITRLMITQRHMKMANDGYKPAFANKIIIFIRRAFNLAIEWDVTGVTTNPAKNLKLLEENNIIERYLTREETQRLIRAVNLSSNPYLKFIVPFMLLTGARKSEALKAQWGEFNFNLGIWRIPISKNGKARHIPITPRLRELLKSIPNSASNYLFPSPRTERPFKDIYNAWNQARVSADLKDVRLHDLRHTFASTLVNNGCSLYEVQQLLGHHSIIVTQRYAHLSHDSLRNAAACAGNLFD